MSIEFDIGGQTYRAAKLDTFAQLHLSRKLSPVLTKLLPAFFRIVQTGQRGVFASLADSLNGAEARVDQQAIDELAAAIEPVAAVLGGMSDQDAEYVYATCLAVVLRNHAGNWAPVWNRQQATCMFDDIDLGVMTQIVARVTMDSLGGFISGLLAKTAGSPKIATSSGQA